MKINVKLNYTTSVFGKSMLTNSFYLQLCHHLFVIINYRQNRCQPGNVKSYFCNSITKIWNCIMSSWTWPMQTPRSCTLDWELPLLRRQEGELQNKEPRRSSTWVKRVWVSMKRVKWNLIFIEGRVNCGFLFVGTVIMM